MKYIVEELSTKELRIRGDWGREVYIEPKFNLDRCVETMKRINCLKAKDGRYIYEAYNCRGYYTYSFFQEHLFWDIIVAYYRYKELIDMIQPEDKLSFANDGRFKTLWDILHSKPRSILRNRRLNLALDVVNHLSAFGRKKVLFFTYGEDDFRLVDITKEMNRANISFARVKCIEKKDILKKPTKLYMGYRSVQSYIHNEYEGLDNIPLFKREHLVNILGYIERLSQDAIEEIKDLKTLLSGTRIKALYGVDDTRQVNSLIVACKLNGIPTYGHQHGLYSKYHIGWMKPGIPRKYNVTFDRIISWSEYWKKKLVQYSSAYKESDVEIGCPMRKKAYHIAKGKTDIKMKNDTLNIMIPYEFAASTMEIGQYIDYFIEKKEWNIIFKLRPDEPIQQQLESYRIKNIEKLSYTIKYSREDLEKIDAVAGTQTTLLYEMIEYGKPIWYLRTSFSLAGDLAKDEIGYEIDFDILENTKDFSKFLKPRYREDTNYYFNRNITLKEIIQRLK